MNRYIPDEILERIRDRADIVEVAASYIQVKRAGSNRFKALCPFHNEKTPSFTLNQERQAYHCFGCGKGGDVFSFIMEKENVDFPNAVHLLADRYGILIPENATGRSDSANDNHPKGPRKDRLFKLNEAATLFFQRSLAEHPHSPVAKYLETRKLPSELITEFKIGAAPDSWDAAQRHLASLGYTTEEMVASGILVKNDTGKIYDRFRNRLMFTIWDEQGRIVGFSGRTVEKESQGGKYVNTPETPLFKKSRILYALPLARETIKTLEHVILCEGQMDAIALHRAGFKNAVAPQGTAFTDEQARILKRYSETVKIAFDSDSAGVKATKRAIEIMLPIGFDIQVVRMPPNSDPDQIFAESGVSGLQNVLNASVDFFEFALDEAKKEHDVSTPWGKSAVTDRMLALIGHITKDVLRAEYASKLAQELALPESAVFTELNKNNRRNAAKTAFVSERRKAFPSPPQGTTGTPEPAARVAQQPTEELPADVAQAETYLLELALAHGTVGRELAEELPTEMISGTPLGKALDMVISLTLNDEWELALNAVKDINNETPSPELSKVLAAPELADSEDGSEESVAKRRKALDDSVRCLKRYRLEQEKTILQSQISADESVLQRYQEVIAELRELEPEHKRLKPKKRKADQTEAR